MSTIINIERLWMKLLRRIMIPMISVLLVMAMSFPSYASPTSQELASDAAQLEDELAGINSELVDLQAEIEQLEEEIEILESEEYRLMESLKEAQKEELEHYESMSARIQYMYEAGTYSYLEIILGATSLADFINRTEFVNQITAYDTQMMDELVAIRERIELEQQSIEYGQAELEVLRSDSETKNNELQIRAEETETDLDQVKAALAEAKAAEEAAEAERKALEEAAAAQNQGNSSSGSSGTTSGGSYEGGAGEVDMLAALLDCEAASDYDSRLAVATVIMNRVADSRFPNSVEGVIYQKGQFPPASSGKLAGIMANGASSLSYQVAADALAGARLGSVSGCLYFLSAGSTSRDGVNVGGNIFFASW